MCATHELLPGYGAGASLTYVFCSIATRQWVILALDVGTVACRRKCQLGWLEFSIKRLCMFYVFLENETTCVVRNRTKSFRMLLFCAACVHYESQHLFDGKDEGG